MKHTTKILLSLLIAAGLTMTSAIPIFALNDKIIAVVNDDVITLKDLHEYLQAVYLQLIAEGKSKSQVEKIMEAYETNGINQLIENKLLVNEANTKGMEIRPKMIDDRINEIKKKYPSEQAFMDALVEDGLTVTDLKNKILDQIKAKYIVQFEVRDKIFVNPQEVTEYYKSNTSQFAKPDRVDFDSIFIPYETDKTTARKKAEEALKRLTNGANFAETAKEYSQTPSVGIIGKGELLSSLEDVVFSLNEGQLSPALETDSGVYIFMAKKKYAAETATLQEVKNEIYNLIFQKKFQERLLTWLEKLRKRAYVEIKE